MNYSKDLTKRINIEQKFADFIYKEFRSKRFGLSPCCSIDQMDKYKIKKELCDWYDKKLELYSATDYAQRNFYPIPENNPDLYSSEDVTTVVGQTPIVTTYTTELVPGEPIIVLDDCQNTCLYPQIYKPSQNQIMNTVVDSAGQDGTFDSMEKGRNVALKMSQQDIMAIPMSGPFSQVTIYSKISWDSIYNYYINDSLIGDEVVQFYQDVEDGNLTNPVLNNVNLPPSGGQGTEYWTPVAQFYVIPGIDENLQPSRTLAYRYKDASLDSTTGNVQMMSTMVGGEQMWKGSLDWLLYPTLYGNDKPFKPGNNTQGNYYSLNGGLYYGVQNDNLGGLKAVVVDGTDVYTTDFTGGGPTAWTAFPNSQLFYYGGSTYSGIFQGSTNIFEIEFLWNSAPVLIDFEKPSCSFTWGIGTVTTADSIDNDGNIILAGTLDTPCTYEGIETWEKIEIITTTGGEDITQTVTVYECKNDNEYIIFKVYDQNGNPIKNYEIILDGGNAGKTDENGIFKTIIENASVNTQHTLNICYCFTTTGACTQKEIKITVTDDSTEQINISKPDCTDIESSE